MNGKLKEILSFAVCIGFLVGAACYMGIFKNLGIADIQKFFEEASGEFLSLKTDFSLKPNDNSRKDFKSMKRIGKYRANNISASVLKGAELSNGWSNIFNSDKKVIFYVYDSSNSNKAYPIEFHKSIEKAYNTNGLNKYYALEAEDYNIYKNYFVGIVAHTKICNSLEECNNMREKSTTKASMQMFLDNCAQNFCIIDAKQKEFFFLRGKNADEAINMLKAIYK